jgi:hypothetical protein
MENTREGQEGVILMELCLSKIRIGHNTTLQLKSFAVEVVISYVMKPRILHPDDGAIFPPKRWLQPESHMFL